MSHRQSGQRAHSRAGFFAGACALFLVVGAIGFLAKNWPLVGYSAGIAAICAWISGWQRQRTVRYVKLSQLSNIVQGAIGHHGMSRKDYDKIASRMFDPDA